jgi:hypothetical protein
MNRSDRVRMKRLSADSKPRGFMSFTGKIVASHNATDGGRTSASVISFALVEAYGTAVIHRRPVYRSNRYRLECHGIRG